MDPAVRARIERLRLPVDDLTWRCDPRVFDFKTTKEVRPLKGIMGQRQALKTLEMGLSMSGPGYNLFICGLGGADCGEELAQFFRERRLRWEPPPDRCYVQNFEDIHRPLLLELPQGRGRKLAARVRGLLTTIQRNLERVPQKQHAAWVRRFVAEQVTDVVREFPGRAVADWMRGWKRHLRDDFQHALADDFLVNDLSFPPARGMPIVFERAPTYANLFGWIGRRPLGDQGMLPHFTEIHSGSLLRADGGVVVLNAADFHSSPGIWGCLKSVLKYGMLQIEEAEPGPSRMATLRPQPINVRTKVVLLGDFLLYDHLFEMEPDFRDIFKLRVDFDSEVRRTSMVVKRDYPRLVSRTCAREGLRPVTAKGVARVVECGVRRAGRKNKISTQSWLIADLLREADYWAGVNGRRTTNDKDVDRAVREAILRVNLVEKKIAEMINEGTILIATSGRRVGQVNGLAIYDMGDYLFAKPSRITAQTSVGQSGIINIERESGFSGRSHDKGVHIVAGYLRSRFAQTRPLSLTASVCFEQSYSGIDGDSASATEIYAILSSLSGLPIRQDIAVTGSLNQKGDIQPIGGVNEKVEGFFDCVRSTRWTGAEGVIIPRKNVNDLVLRDDVVEAIRKKKFHLFAIDSVEHGIEILTETPVGRRRKNGTHTPRSVFGLVDERLDQIAAGLRKSEAES